MSATTAQRGPASPSAKRGRSAAGIIIFVVVVLIALMLITLIRPSPSASDFALDNPRANGAKAVAQVLRGQGVDIVQADSTADAVREAGEGTTLAILGRAYLEEAQLTALREVRADIVLIDADEQVLRALTSDELVIGTADHYEDRLYDAECDDPDATAAGSIAWGDEGLMAYGGDRRASLCFSAGGAGPAGYAVWNGTPRVAAIAPGDVVLNGTVLDDGNAALALRSLGRHDKLVWWVAANEQVAHAPNNPKPGLGLLPGWMDPVMAMALIAAGAAALWRGRRFGKLVPEPLPVAVPASQVTLGLGRLYRRGRARGHAAAALRAGCVTDLAGIIGLSPNEHPASLVRRVADATGRAAQEVAGLIYGPPPASDADLVNLANQLDQLRREVTP